MIGNGLGDHNMPYKYYDYDEVEGSPCTCDLVYHL